MNTTKEQQKELDDALEPTLQVVLDALKLTPFYNVFEISADVPEIYMQEFWVTVTRHHSSLHSKLDVKSHIVNVDNFRDMLKICPKLPDQKFEEPSLEEDILSFIRDLGHTGEIKFLSDVNVNYMHQLWRSFAAIINKCLSGKTTALENLVFQVENKNSKKNYDMYYPRFTKFIFDYFMAKDQAIPKRNKMFWHYARDELTEEVSTAKGDKPATTKSKESEEESWTFSQGEDEEEDEEHDSDDDNDDNDDEDDDQENDNQRTESDDEGDDFVHPNLSTYIADDQEKEKEKEKADDDDDDVTSD
ncbi:hypothetical protein Tco_1272827 [Tanacetum coccineum]